MSETTINGMAPGSVTDLVARIRNPDGAVCGPAWQSAHGFGAAAVRPLAALMADPDFEAARNAKRALYNIVRHAGRPGAEREAREVEGELLTALNSAPGPNSNAGDTMVRRQLLWLLSEIGSDRAVRPIARWLSDAELREDARCVLLRIPGKRATAALRRAWAGAPDEFKPALAEALRKRGVQVAGDPNLKLLPTRQTSVTPLRPK